MLCRALAGAARLAGPKVGLVVDLGLAQLSAIKSFPECKHQTFCRSCLAGISCLLHYASRVDRQQLGVTACNHMTRANAGLTASVNHLLNSLRKLLSTLGTSKLRSHLRQSGCCCVTAEQVVRVSLLCGPYNMPAKSYFATAMTWLPKEP